MNAKRIGLWWMWGGIGTFVVSLALWWLGYMSMATGRNLQIAFLLGALGLWWWRRPHSVRERWIAVITVAALALILWSVWVSDTIPRSTLQIPATLDSGGGGDG
jgi:uncharacterized membrane protein YfcA